MSRLKVQVSENRGNFIELLTLRCHDSPWLLGKLQSGSGHRWISNITQNEILGIFAKEVHRNIISEIEQSVEFSVIMDETADVATHEQVSISARYIFESKIYERFLGFFVATSTTGQALKDILVNTLHQLKIDPKNIVAFGLDGASNMSGGNKGLAALMNVHCHGHRVILATQIAASPTYFFLIFFYLSISVF